MSSSQCTLGEPEFAASCSLLSWLWWVCVCVCRTFARKLGTGPPADPSSSSLSQGNAMHSYIPLPQPQPEARLFTLPTHFFFSCWGRVTAVIARVADDSPAANAAPAEPRRVAPSRAVDSSSRRGMVLACNGGITHVSADTPCSLRVERSRGFLSLIAGHQKCFCPALRTLGAMDAALG